ncbi:MAG: hypothetical protein WCL27_02505 [Betaproteobacteria bacterium]
MMIKIESAGVSFSMGSVLLSKISRHGTPDVFIYSEQTTGTTRLSACAAALLLAFGLILNSGSL